MWRWVKMIAGLDGEMLPKSWQAFGILSLTLLNDVKSFGGGLKRKQKKASRSITFLAEVLAGQGAS